MSYADPQNLKEMLLNQPIPLNKSILGAELEKTFTRILNQGYESIASEQIMGIIDIGYPVFDFSGNIATALVIPFIEHIDDPQTTNFEKTKNILQETAASLSKSLGYIVIMD